MKRGNAWLIVETDTLSVSLRAPFAWPSVESRRGYPYCLRPVWFTTQAT
ncbi:hypothetical protein TREES_T100002798 [Tupaia chinensis]|uniref:Uncharacterized protein n=1 Tax=Tupaia chinensis TaxID=246437 RepID=L9KY90_TUPCH|nr:hypothetical protein TREES_T100002798 [Tupaia chinensis]